MAKKNQRISASNFKRLSQIKSNGKSSTNTNALTKGCLSYLQMSRFNAWRQNNLSVRGRAFVGMRGLTDIIGFHLDYNATFLAVEIKGEGDKLSEEQIDFIKSVQKAGGFACAVWSLGELIKFHKEWKMGKTLF